MIGTAKQGVGLKVIGEGCLPLLIKNPKGEDIDLDVDAKHAPAVRLGLWGLIPLVDNGLNVLYTKDKALVRDDEYNVIFEGPRICG